MSKELLIHSYAQALLKHTKGEEVEIYCGDTKTTMKFADFEQQQKHVIRGKIMNVMGDCLMVECSVGKNHCTVFLNAWSIKAVIKVSDPMYMKDVFRDEETFSKSKN